MFLAQLPQELEYCPVVGATSGFAYLGMTNWAAIRPNRFGEGYRAAHLGCPDGLTETPARRAESMRDEHQGLWTAGNTGGIDAGVQGGETAPPMDSQRQ